MRAAALTLALAAAAAFGQTSPAKTMVVVNGQAIMGGQYLKRMEVLPGVGQLVNDKFIPATPGFLTLNKLINETLMLQLAKEKGVYPSDQEIQKSYDERLKQNPDILKAFQTIGFTEADFRYDVLIQLVEFKLVTMGVNITAQEVENFYKENPSSFSHEKLYRLRVITVKGPAARESVDSALAMKKPFGEVARQYSTDATKAQEGLVGDVPETALGEAYTSVIKNREKGYVSSWLERDGASIKLFVEDVIPAKALPLDAELRESIRRDLMVTRGQVKNDLNAMMAEFRKKAKIEYQGTAFDAQLKQLFGGQ
ncbi:MAG: peptidyl-prolyl cis-trans isomerase [Fimbriimonadaceae bacterium]|nr:peptidyl-prolyl cis-trans isomerase [Fimbriimonadaceae bacterium]QYK55467.1 MAG: peptidyl-prolyl cis-trans isomerase [Fimbriimonadaceae bacterium]